MKKMTLKRKHNSHKPRKHLDINRVKKSLALLSKNIEKNTSSAYKKVRRKTANAKHDMDQYVNKKPYRFMGMSMLAGICIGYIMHRH